MENLVEKIDDPYMPAKPFLARLLPAFLLLAWGIYAMLLVWIKGLNQTNMNDIYGFALWIWVDLAIIALGGGAFFTGLLTYFFKREELTAVINFAVLVGVICYSSAMLILAIDIGQPLRFWFIFWHPNVHSMLTEVAFCLTVYYLVLNIEYLPTILNRPNFQKIPFLKNLGHNTHSIMALFAGIGVFLSFFHQGSLGGLTGVLYGRPYSYREGFLIWPWTFFLYTWSAAASGPCFTLILTKICELLSGKKLIPDAVTYLLAKISGWLLLTYVIAKSIDTLYWALITAPEMGFQWSVFYTKNWLFHGYWIVFIEIVMCGFIPAIILIQKKGRQNKNVLWAALLLTVLGLCMNRWTLVMQTVAMPVLPFENWHLYLPNWQEIATTLLPVAWGTILIALSMRFLPLFPAVEKLNSIENSEE